MKIKALTNFYESCQKEFSAHVETGLAQFPDAAPSHLCVRSTTPSAYKRQQEYGGNLGDITHTQHKGRDITWVKLDLPLTHKQHRLHWLELTAFDPLSEDETGPQMLVFAHPDFTEAKKICVREVPPFFIRCQKNSAEVITGYNQK
ncbi:MAG: hypothetical protein JWM96_270 [Alphaproteobacteria bacterium]|nr:hypothetical protein [Alphaproteobacteria bacterium]